MWLSLTNKQKTSENKTKWFGHTYEEGPYLKRISVSLIYEDQIKSLAGTWCNKSEEEPGIFTVIYHYGQDPRQEFMGKQNGGADGKYTTWMRKQFFIKGIYLPTKPTALRDHLENLINTEAIYS